MLLIKSLLKHLQLTYGMNQTILQDNMIRQTL